MRTKTSKTISAHIPTRAEIQILGLVLRLDRAGAHLAEEGFERFGVGLVVVVSALGELAGLDALFAVRDEGVEVIGAGAVGAVRVVVMGGFALGVGEIGAESFPAAFAVGVVKRAMLQVEAGVFFRVKSERVSGSWASHLGHSLHLSGI